MLSTASSVGLKAGVELLGFLRTVGVTSDKKGRQ